jgi:hypothetical protein
VRVNLRGMVVGMEESFKSFGIGFIAFFHPAVSDSGRAVPVFRRPGV